MLTRRAFFEVLRAGALGFGVGQLMKALGLRTVPRPEKQEAKLDAPWAIRYPPLPQLKVEPKGIIETGRIAQLEFRDSSRNIWGQIG
jgi:hypothetical protein